MTSKERVKTALAHQEPDRPPVDFRARDEVAAALRTRLELKPEERLDDALGVDLWRINTRFPEEAAPSRYADPTVAVTQEGLYLDIWGAGFKESQTESGSYMELAYSPLRECAHPHDIASYPWPTADQWDYSRIADDARAGGDKWVWAHSRGVFEIAWFLRGFDGFLMDMMMEPERAADLLDHIHAYLMARTRRILEAGEGLIDMVEYNDDAGGQGGMLVNPDQWRELIKPRMASFIKLVKSYGVKVQYHSCGGIRPIIPDLIEIGLDVLNPVQTLATGMEPMALKQDFGDKLCFNGGIDTQQLLPYGTTEEVRATTRWMIDTMGRDGGYILASAHRYQGDVPLENILAVYETALGCSVSA